MNRFAHWLRRVSLAFVAATTPAVADGKFVGALTFTEEGCERVLKCFLKEPFGFMSPTVGNWQTPAGAWTNGASIPRRLQGWFGSPFDADLIRAAVVHDHYCDRHVRTWSDTNWVFYEALLASGVERSRAEWMYAGVLIGSPKWVRVVDGRPCTGLGQCVQRTVNDPLPDGGVTKRVEEAVYWVRGARYEEPDYENELESFMTRLKALSQPPTRADFEAIVKSVRPQDPFINGPDTIARPNTGVVQ